MRFYWSMASAEVKEVRALVKKSAYKRDTQKGLKTHFKIDKYKNTLFSALI